MLPDAIFKLVQHYKYRVQLDYTRGADMALSIFP